MRKSLVAWVVCLFMIAGCTIGPVLPNQRGMLTNQIAGDALTFNEVYSDAVAGQILMNILRARDRLPRQYMTISGFADKPTLSIEERAGLGGVNLGDIGSPWAVGELGRSRTTSTEPAFSVEPFTADAFSAIVLEPVKTTPFIYYWRNGWSRELLLYLLVERMEVRPLGSQNITASYLNDGVTISDGCRAPDESEGCAYKFAVENLIHAIGRRNPDVLALQSSTDEAAIPPPQSVNNRPIHWICGLVEVYGARGEQIAALRPLPQLPDDATLAQRIEARRRENCAPRLVVDGMEYTLRLRSLDDAVYYLGELLRDQNAANADPGANPIRSRLSIPVAGMQAPRDDDPNRNAYFTPLFWIIPQDAQEADAAHFAARVRYNGRTYLAGAAVSRSCNRQAPDEGACARQSFLGDRSAQVLGLFLQLQALNQSAEASSAPDYILTR
jgi:hypothetical protein